MSVTELSRSLGSCAPEDFQRVCNAIPTALRSPGGTTAAGTLGAALLDALKAYLGAVCPARCPPLVDLLGELCAQRDFVRSLPDQTIRGVMRELLRRLDGHGWTKKLPDGPQLLRKTNEACVKLLHSMHKPYACSMLLDLGLRESDVVNPVLVRKCLKKLHKSLVSSEMVERILDALLEFVRNSWQAQRRLSIATLPSSDGLPLTDSARELATACREAMPEVVDAWGTVKLPTVPLEELPHVQDLLGFVARDKGSGGGDGQESLGSSSLVVPPPLSPVDEAEVPARDPAGVVVEG